MKCKGENPFLNGRWEEEGPKETPKDYEGEFEEGGGHFKRNPAELGLSLRDWILTGGEINPCLTGCVGDSFWRCFPWVQLPETALTV